MTRPYLQKVCFSGYWPEHAILDGTWRPLRDREAEDILSQTKTNRKRCTGLEIPAAMQKREILSRIERAFELDPALRAAPHAPVVELLRSARAGI
jgi:hypothetical protein